MSSNILKADNGVSSGTTGLVYTAGNDGTLQLATTTSGGTATTAITIDNSQNVGVGVTPSAWGSSRKAIQVGSSSVTVGHFAGSATNTIFGNNFYNDGTNVRYINAGAPAQAIVMPNDGSFAWAQYTGNLGAGNIPSTSTTAMTLDNSGNFLVGTTTTGGANSNSTTFRVSPGAWDVNHVNGTSSGSGYVAFYYNAAVIGSITQNGTTGVLYNLTSDYRLKNNPVPVTGAKDFVMALQPKTWDWWDGSGKGVGFIAHEFMEVAKYSGHGEKDETKQEEYEITPAVKDEQGNITTPAVMGTRTVPVYQSIQPSSSEVMANLVAYIQELSAEVTALKAKVGV